MHHYLRPLLCPESVALVGASERPGSLGRVVLENLLGGEFKGELFPVNPNHARVLTHKTYGSIAAIGRPIDLAVIATPPDSVPGILEDVPRSGLKAAVLMTAPSYASKADAYAWTRKVASIARKQNIRLVGPGGFGVIRTDIGLNATFCAPSAQAGRLALVTQSGAVSAAMLDFAAPLHIGFSTVISLGGGIDVGFGELLDSLVLDPATDGILLYVEEPGDARTFLSALRGAARTKPVVVLKAGRSLEPRRVPSPDTVFDAALMRAGTVRVHTYTQLFAAARILAMGRIPRGERLAIVSNGRGPGLLAADEASLRGVTLAKLAPATVAALDAILPHTSDFSNPVDVRGDATPERFAAAVHATLADPTVDAVVALHVARPAFGATDAARAVATAARESGKPVLGAWLGAVNRREADNALEAGGIANFYTPETAVDAFSFLAAYRRNQAWLLEVPSPQPTPEPPDLAKAERIRETAEREGRTRLMTGELQTLLVAFGIATPPFAIVETLTEAEAAVRRFHFPVVLALDSDEPDGGAATREVRTGRALAKAWGELHLGPRDPPPAGFSGHTLVRRVLPAHRGPAFAISVATDAVFGPVITLGAGGGAAVMPSTMLPPLNHRLAQDLVSATFGEKRAPASLQVGEETAAALVQALTQVSTLVCALPWLRTLELQPMIVDGGRVLVLSGRAVVDPKKKPQQGYRHMAIHPYPAEMIEETKLRDGTPLQVRPIRPEDAELEREFVHALSEESRFFRFFYQLSELTPAMLARFTQVDYDRELALVAVHSTPKDGETFVGVARYIANPDHESAEFAVVVADAWQGRGVAYVLMERLIAAAKKRGLLRLEGTVLRANQNMLRFTTALGFHTSDDAADPDQVIVERAL